MFDAIVSAYIFLCILYVIYMIVREVYIWIGYAHLFDNREITAEEYWNLKNERGSVCTTEGFIIFVLLFFGLYAAGQI